MKWEVVPAVELIEKRVGSVNPANFQNEEFELFSIPAFDTGSPEILVGSEIGSSKKCVEPDDVLISRIVPHIRRCWVVPSASGNRQIASGEWITFRSKRVFPQYLKHYLVSNVFHQQFMQTVSGVGGSLLRARPSEVERIEIPLPPLKEQKRIAAILDKADSLRRKRQQAIQLADQFLHAVFLDMFGDPASDKWTTIPVEALAQKEKGSIRTGPFGSQLLHSEFVDEGIAVLGIDNAVNNEFRWAKPRYISEDKYQELSRYTVRPKDLLITIMGTCGRVAIVPDDIPLAINTKHLCCITLDNELCKPDFLHSYFLMHPASKSYLFRSAKGAVMDGLNMGIIKQLPVHLPPIELQQKYSDIYERTKRTKETANNLNDEAQILFQSLSQKAFAGEL